MYKIKFILKSLNVTNLLFLLILLFPFNLVAKNAFYIKNHIVIDLEKNIEWLRCSVGQVWDGKNCNGIALKLTMDQIPNAITQVNDQLGGQWRLPSRTELENIVCSECGKVKIDSKVFPNTPYEPFWTKDTNKWSKKFFWTVNFYTGHTFGRFPGSIPNFVRFVRER